MFLIKQDIELMEESINNLKKRLAAMRQYYAEQECPISVGDVVEMAGFYYTGKKMKVTAIHPAEFSFEGDWKVVGNILKVNGEAGLQIADFSHNDWLKSRADV